MTAEESVSAVMPSTGPSDGNTPVHLEGSGFVNSLSLTCQFGFVIVSAQWLSPNRISCVAPPKPPGTELVVKASNNGFEFSSSFAIFMYQGTNPLAFPPLLLHDVSGIQNSFNLNLDFQNVRRSALWFLAQAQALAVRESWSWGFTFLIRFLSSVVSIASIALLNSSLPRSCSVCPLHMPRG